MALKLYRVNATIIIFACLLYFILLHCILYYCIVLYCIVLYFTILYCIVLYFIVFYCIVLYCIVLYCIVLYCIVLYCIVLYCIVLYFIFPLTPQISQFLDNFVIGQEFPKKVLSVAMYNHYKKIINNSNMEKSKNVEKLTKKLKFFPNDIMQHKHKHDGIRDILRLMGEVLWNSTFKLYPMFKINF